MSKKIIVLISVLVLILVAGGFFWWRSYQEWKTEGLLESIKVEPLENYKVKETPEGKVVEDKRGQLFIKVPEGWEVKTDGLCVEEGVVSFFTSDAEVGPNCFLNNGCWVGVKTEYRYSEKKFKLLENLIAEVKQMPPEQNIDSRYGIVEIDGRTALKEVVTDNPELGKNISVLLPVGGDKIYRFDTFLAPKNQERCLQEFNDFLKTVSINK